MTLAIDTETTGLFIHKGCRAFTISAACDEGSTYLWKFKVDTKTRDVIYKNDILQDFFDTVAKHEALVFHNANFDLQALEALGLPWDSLFNNHDIHDTMVMSHAYKSKGPHGLKQLGVTMLSMPEDDEQRLSKITQAATRKAGTAGWTIASKRNPHPYIAGTQKEHYKCDYWVPEQYAKRYRDSPKEWLTICDEYAKKDAVRTILLYDVFQELMTAKQTKAYNKSRKLIRPILDMQKEGVTVIPEELEGARKEYNSKVSIHLSKLCTILKSKDFNPNSPKQLQKALYTTLKFDPKKVKKGKSGLPSTDKESITKLMQDCPPTGELPRKFQFLLELKKLRKAKTTLQYINNYNTHKNEDNVIHPFFKQTATGTGRLGCENPNTTNVGKQDMSNPFAANERVVISLDKEDDSFKLRNVFGPRNSNVWTCIDYQQFQLLIFAVVSESKQLLEAFENGDDVHHATARVIFGKDDISAVERTAAKNVNFGILFGAGPKKIDTTAGMPGLYSLFLKKFPKAKQYLDKCSEQARRKGYVHTVGGYRLYVPQERSYAASCYVIQGTEAEIVKASMVAINGYTRTQRQCPYKMIMMVHDELVFFSARTDKKHLRSLMNIMEQEGDKLGIPAKVDAEIVKNNWSTKESITA